MQEAKKFALDVGLTFIASIFNIFLVFVISIILARYLGATDLGLYRMAYTFYGIATMIGALGVPAAVIKYTAEYKDDRANLDKIVSSGIITSLIIGIAFSIIIYLSSQTFASLFHMPQLKGLLELLSPVFPFVLVNASLFGMLNGLREMKIYATATILQQILMTIFTIALIYYGLGVSGAMIGIVFSAIGSSAYLAHVCKGHFNLIFNEYIKTTRKLMSFGTQMLGANLINTINLQADTVFLGYFLTAADVGYYGAATGLSKFFWMVPQAIQTISYPAASEYWAKKNIAGLQKMIDKSMKYTALALMPSGLAIGFFAEEIVTRIYGQSFSYSALPLQILLVGTVIFGIACTSIGGSLAGANRPDLSMKAAGFSAIINIILNVLLIPLFGIIGAAIATSSSLIIMALIFYVLTIKTLALNVKIEWLIEIAGVAVLGIILFMILSALINLDILRAGILILFVALSFAFLLSKDDITLVRSFILSLIR